MAMHYLKNIETGEVKNIRTETLHRYDMTERGPWRAFDTEEDRDACATLPERYALHPHYAGEGWRKVRASESEQYRTEGYIMFDTQAEAEAMTRPCYRLEGLDVRAVTECERVHKPKRGCTYYATKEEAQAARPATVWLCDRFESGNCFEVTEAEATEREYPPRQYVRGKTKAECVANLPPLYTWDANRLKYVRLASRSGITLLRVNRQLFRALEQERDTFNAFDYVEGDADEGGLSQRNTSRELVALFARFMQSKGASARYLPTTDGLQNDTRRELTARYVSRVNAIAGREVLKACDRCAANVFQDGYGSDHDGAHLCEACAQRFVVCPTCSESGARPRWHLRTACIAGDDGAMFCRSHPPVFRDPPRGALAAYSTDVTTRKASFLKCETERGADMWLGWELEVYPVPGVTVEKAVLKARELFADFIVCKSDSSISGGFEIVSVPATLQWHRENSVPFLRNMRGLIEGWKHNNAGLHVHVGRKELHKLQEGRMAAFVDHPGNAKFITAVAGRDPTTYCQRLLKKLAAPQDTEGRYHALNFATKNDGATAEYRIFRSNVSPLGFLKCLEFVHCAVTWARNAGNLEVAPYQIGLRVNGANPFDRNAAGVSWRRAEEAEAAKRATLNADDRGAQAFIAYARKHRGEYPVLFRWLQENGYAEGLRYEPVSVGA